MADKAIIARSRRRASRPSLESLESRELLATLYVATTGSDSSPSGNPTLPFRSIQHAVTLANSGDTIKVAAGTYGYSASADQEGRYTQNFGTSTVFTLINKQLSILGGYRTSDWNAYNPTANLTVIDGADTYRGVLVVGGGQPTSLTLQGFTITRGLARGIPARGGTDAIDGLGGGMLVDLAPVTVIDTVFSQNRALGENTSQAVGGAGAGGALALRGASSATGGTLTNVVFDANQAVGGVGSSRGGFGHGGGLFVYQYTINGSSLTFTNNIARGGDTAGGGSGLGDLADGQGGGFAAHIGSIVNLSGVKAFSNQVIGGSAPNGDAGGAFGGGGYAERASLVVVDGELTGNTARGGSGRNDGSSAAGFANGGGIMTINSSLRLDRNILRSNTAQGGNGATYKGVSGGGGLAVVRQVNAQATADVVNSLIAGNTAAYGGGSNDTRGGGGGGVWIDGPNTSITHSTIVDNAIVGSEPSRPTQVGQGILVGPVVASVLNLSYSIVANHANTLNSGSGFAAALGVQPGSTVNLNRNLFANNSQATNQGGVPSPSGTYNGSGSNLIAVDAGFVAGVAPTFDYRLKESSPAVNAAVGSPASTDLTKTPRIGIPDLGAYELRPPPTLEAVAIFRVNTAQWFTQGPTGGRQAGTYGAPNLGDIPVSADFDGDGTNEPAIFRPSTAQWFALDANGGRLIASFGAPGLFDIPVPGDYDGDGRDEPAVFRPSTAQWFAMGPTGGRLVAQFGAPNLFDLPVPGDYFKEGRDQPAVYRPSTAQWFSLTSNGGRFVGNFGAPNLSDLPVPGDYDGDGQDEPAVFRPSTAQWFAKFLNGGRLFTSFGATNLFDLPVGTPVGALVRLGRVGASFAASSSSGKSAAQVTQPLILADPPAANPFPSQESQRRARALSRT